ncbi:hypothetical protein ONA91_25920 [Micromonospora sp. DR5-3]|uniref:hypothetical protein n=1 Tax=unclassified Micromonospora TaxID=2617518 RepID=UPI0011D575D7|nr:MULTISPECIES: hypothetical protein [unclassified Micromonospora]MCW3817892.1 hypothetical protein [Micromonospora sp. DR5-3]TYC22943.1 hypothetical protein FXF52_17965 [Micromonospora sp. MP36]
MSQENRDRPVELSREDEGYVITARWHNDDGSHEISGPDEVIIRLADGAAPEVRQWGVTSAVLHRMGRQVDDMVAEAHEMPSVGAYQVMVRRYIEGRLAELAKARGTTADGFEIDLLAVFEDLAGRGHADPLGTLATATGRSRADLDHLLGVARQRDDHDGA